MPFRRTLLSCASLALAALATLPAGAATPAGATLAPVAQAHTFAQVRQGDTVHTLLALKLDARAGTLMAIDLSASSGSYSSDAFDVIGRFDAAALDTLASQAKGTRAYPLERLLGVGPRGLAHIAAGTNYPAHGAEVGMHEAFLFPKLSPAGGPRTTVVAAPGALLDYEVEVCARFDRELRSSADFDAARKGFFLCGDFSDRATLVRNIDLANPASGDGFADAKSGPDRFPTGALLVVPRDWKAFLQDVTIATHVDGRQRQHAKAGDMIKDLRAIVTETLDEAGTRTWSYAGGRIPMVARAAISTDSAVLTGTGDGVVFKEPEPAVIKAVMAAKDRAGQMAQIEHYLALEAAKRIYLQPGNRVRHSSNVLGWIDTTVVPNH